METHFSKEQLKDKDNQSSEKIFRNVCTADFAMLLALHIYYWEMSWTVQGEEYI